MCSACLLCNSPGIARNSAGQKTYYWCAACDYIYLDPGMRIPPQLERARYEEHNNSLEEPGYVAFLQRFLDSAVLPFLLPGMKVLDYGCGPQPVLSELLKRQGYGVDAYDPFFFPTPPAGRYDVITCTEVVEHVFDPRSLWAGFAELLVPGGMLCVMTRLHSGIEQFADWWYRRDATHVGFYSHRTLSSVAELFPFDLVQSNGYDVAVFRRK